MNRPLASSACVYAPTNGARRFSTTSRPPTRPWHARPLPAAPLHATLRPNAPPVNPATARETRAVAPSLPLRTRVATGAGLAVAGLSRRVGAGEGSVIGGRVLLAVDPGALSRLAAGRPVALVSGTNGKTTTTSMLAAALGTRGPVVTNSTGANLMSGLVT